MKKIIFVLVVFGSLSSFAASACFSATKRQYVHPYGDIKVGTVCIESKEGTHLYDNEDVTVSVYWGDDLVDTFRADSGPVSPASHHCGGKEHDCWDRPASFVLSGKGTKYSVWIDLSPGWNSAHVNRCVRCGGGRIKSLEGGPDLDLWG